MKVGLFINTQFPEGFKLEVCIPAGPAGHLQSEYMVPRANTTAAIANLSSIGDRIDRHLWTTEIRSMAGDRLWLSPSYGDDHVGIHFSWRREPYAVQAISAEIETMLPQFGARPQMIIARTKRSGGGTRAAFSLEAVAASFRETPAAAGPRVSSVTSGPNLSSSSRLIG
jgi:hypothetical protein